MTSKFVRHLRTKEDLAARNFRIQAVATSPQFGVILFGVLIVRLSAALDLGLAPIRLPELVINPW